MHPINRSLRNVDKHEDENPEWDFYQTATDEELLKEWYKGDRIAFRYLYQKYYPLAVPFCIRLCGNRTNSEDLVQKTFIKIVEKVEAGKGKRITSFSKYLFTALKINYFEYLRKRINAREQPFDAKVISLEEKTAPDDQIERFMENNTIETILSQLDNPNQRMILRQHLEGYSYDEIARQNKMTKSQVRGLLFRAKENLMEIKEKIRSMINGIQSDCDQVFDSS